MNSIQKICLSSLLLMFFITGAGTGFFSASAKHDPTKTNRKNLALLAIGDSLITSIPAVSGDTQLVHRIVNRITLTICADTNLCYTDSFTFSARFKVLFWDKTSNVIDSIDTVELAVSYNPVTGRLYTEQNTYVFYNARKVTVIPLDYSSTAYDERVCLQNEMDVERWWNMAYFYTDSVSFTGLPVVDPVSGDYVVSWYAKDWAEEYDVEWMWVDNYLANGEEKDAALIHYNFLDNAGRATVKGNTWRFSPIYDRGYLIIRIRAVGYGGTDFKHRVPAAWTIYDGDAWVYNLLNNTYGLIKITAAHQSLKNWQYSASFAEEGKKKEVVSYHDGSLRGRQTVTRNNSDNMALVAETFYDHQGRAAVQALPAPAFSERLNFFSRFNINELNQPYSKVDFDTDYVACATVARIFKNDSGASRYYSAQNPLKAQLHHQFIADAAGYPFTQTEYTADNTGRIRRQSGVGAMHQLGSSHETEYFYETPLQRELDELFGTNVGYAEHYRKEVVKDANGQFGVSYLDLKGRAVATSLAGNAPANLLENTGNADTLVREDFLPSIDSLAEVDGELLLTRQLVVKNDNSVHHIAYSLNRGLFSQCLPENICYECVYDLEISLKDDCGNEILPGGKLTRTIGAVFSGMDTLGFDSVCRTDTLLYRFQQDTTFDGVRSTLDTAAITVLLNKGSYQLSRKLTVNKLAMDYYAARYLKENTCITPLDTFIKRELAKIDTTSCFNDCEKCKVKLGTESQFVTGMISVLISDSLQPTTADTLAFQSQYATEQARCQLLCDPYPDRCRATYLMMLDDMSPGGQYGMYKRKYYNIAGVDIDSIIVIKALDTTVYEIKRKIHPLQMGSFKLADKILTGLCYDSIYVDTALRAVTDLSKNEILNNWNPDWAKKLIKLHPEYCKYEQCASYKESDWYDFKMAITDHYTTARDSGYLNPLGITNGTVDTTKYPVRNQDPWFALSGNSAYKTAMHSVMLNYPGIHLSLWRMMKLVNCFSLNDTSAVKDCINGYENDSASCTRSLDQEWMIFKMYYLTAKGAQQDLKMQIACPYMYDSNGTAVNFESAMDLMALHGKKRRFYSNDNAVEENGVDKDDKNKPDKFYAVYKNRRDSTCIMQCASYKDKWLEQIGDCSFTPSIARNYFIIHLYDVCMAGCDPNNVMGASSVNPKKGAITINVGGNNYPVTSFEEVFNAYVAEGFIDLGVANADSLRKCNVNLLAFPGKYRHNYFLNQYDPLHAMEAPDTIVHIDSTLTEHNYCTCEKIEQLAGNYNGSIELQSCYTSLSAYISKAIGYSYTEDEIGILRDACRFKAPSKPGGFQVSGTGCHQIILPARPIPGLKADSTFIPKVIKRFSTLWNDSVYAVVYLKDTADVPRVPPALKCLPYEVSGKRNCITCDKAIDQAVAFIEKYEASPDTTFALHQLYTNIMNSTYGFNLTYPEYLAFLSTCDTIYKVLFNLSYKTADNQELPQFNEVITIPTPMDFSGGIDENSEDVGSCACSKLYDMYLAFADMASKNKLPAGFTFADMLEINNFEVDFDPDNFTIEDLLDKCKSWKNIDSLVTREITCDTVTFCTNGLDTMFTCPDPPPGYWMDSMTVCDTSYTLRYCEIIQTMQGPSQVCTQEIDCQQVNDSLSANPDYSVMEAQTYLKNKYLGEFTVLKANVPVQTEFCDTCSKAVFAVCGDLTQTATEYFEMLNQMAMMDTLDSDTLDLNYIYSFKNSSFNRKKNSPTCSNNGNDNKATFKGTPAAEYEGPAIVGADLYDYIFSIGYDSASYDCQVVFDSLKVQSLDSLRYFFNIRPSSVYAAGKQHFTFKAIVTGGDTIEGKGFTACFNVSNCCAPSEYLCNQPIVKYGVPQNNCVAMLKKGALANAMVAYENYLDSVENAFRTAYLNKCMASAKTEKFYQYYRKHQYHYTLYYYDQAGNLVQTVPPAGVSRFGTAAQTDSAHWYRKNNTAYQYLPGHILPSVYNYNSLNQLIWQRTPDADTSEFFYDRLGRLAFSQNKKQKNASTTEEKKYSYTVYDVLGRINEVGEVRAPHLVTHERSRRTSFINDSALTGSRSEITRTKYDYTLYTVSNGTFTQQHLRGRVAHVTYQDADNTDYRHAVHYTYDIHGNVNAMVRENLTLTAIGQQYKQVDYDYDLISGKVNMVSYQQGEPDQYFHRYEYDADNRLTQVYTSTDSVHWDKDARYYYYLHGPLARTEVGHHKVQGIDYAYTLHGWLKGINSNTLTPERDMGKDGWVSGANTNRNVARDVYGFTLSYYSDTLTREDYRPVNNSLTTAQLFEAKVYGSTFHQAAPGLYNGNIRHMVVAISKFMESSAPPLGYAYQYDQLNRLKTVNTYNNINQSTNEWNTTGSALTDYNNTFTYDANGNILTQLRKGSTASGTDLDNLSYTYKAHTNQLTHVDDAVTGTAYTDDIDDQSADNYEYDEIGNLVKDVQEEIETIEWTVYGKIKRITRTSTSLKPNLEFEYTPDGHRVCKIVKPKVGSNLWTYTYYVRDAQGNIMATYDRKLEAIFNPENTNYAAINAELVGLNGAVAFKDFIQTLHPQISSTDFIDSVKQEVIDDDREWRFANHFSPSWYLNSHITWYELARDGFDGDKLLTGFLTTKGLIDVCNKLCADDMMGFLQYLITANGSEYLEALGTYDFSSLESMYYAAGGTGPTPSADVMISTILTNWNAYLIANWISSNGGCVLNIGILQNDPMPSVIFTLLYSYPNLKTAFINQYTISEIIDAMIAYDIEYTWQFVIDGLSPGTVMDEIFNHEPTTAYDVLLQYFWAYVDEVQTANYYYSKTQYFQHIKDEYGQYTYDVLVGKFIHLSNQFKDMFALTEWHLYGSSRLGVQKPKALMLSGAQEGAGRELVHIEFEGTWNQYTESVDDTSNTSTTTYQMSYDYFTLTRGEKNYEMVNHLGNVLVIISDKKLKTCTGDTVNYYMADVLQATDYSAFHATLKDRVWYADATNKYRFGGSNGQERDDEVSGEARSYSAEFWQYSPDLGRRFNVDKVIKPWESSYASFANSPLLFLDPNGADVINGHAEERAKKLEEMNKAKALLDNMNPEDPQYSTTLNNYNKAEEDFKSVDTRYQRIERKIEQLKKGDENLYKIANELTDECDIDEVDIYVFDVDHDKLGNKSPFPEQNTANTWGNTDAKPTISSGNHSTGQRYKKVESAKGTNTVIIQLSSESTLGRHFAHELGHTIYNVKNTTKYSEWINNNPKQAQLYGHGIGDPTGEYANMIEKNYARNNGEIAIGEF